MNIFYKLVSVNMTIIALTLFFLIEYPKEDTTIMLTGIGSLIASMMFFVIYKQQKEENKNGNAIS